MKDKLYFILTEEEYKIIVSSLSQDIELDLFRAKLCKPLVDKLKEQYEANKTKHKPKTQIPRIVQERKSKYE